MKGPQYIEVWNNCLQMIKDVIPQQAFSTWFSPLKAISLEDNTLTLEVPSEFVREYLEEHYIGFIGKALRKQLGDGAKLMYNVRIAQDARVNIPSEPQRELKNKSLPIPRNNADQFNPYAIPGLRQLNIDPHLSPKNTFANFVEGECNRLGLAAGKSIANKPGNNSFNPLFIYGGPGMGKTHLAQAIGIEIKEKYPDKVVLYVSANTFMTQFIDAVSVKNKYADFLQFYQMIDVLILDDVHEFAEKEGTQNAFFHIFNHLQQSGKQLILTSDKAPVDLVGLEKRLLSRFKWGLSVELTQPSYETRLRILESKSRKDGIDLPKEVLQFLASKVVGSVREIEGTLISLIAHATLINTTIDMDLAQTVTDKIVKVSSNEISVDTIQDTVCEYFNITRDALASKTRKREIVQARQIAMYMCRNFTKISLAAIGQQIGGKDHATVVHSCNIVQDLIATNKTFKQYVVDIENRLKF